MAKVWLGLGSNLGDRERFILDAVTLLGKAALRETRVSSLWESKARYVTDQPDFLNAAVSGQTDLTPAELL
ncbi:MAG: 2-amino-4-hydroxy-6-hydroxymethyldihydropteridine diphosphokinase, partial [Rectinema sp.]